MTNIDTIHTCCKKCVFAIFDDKTQIDCALKYIDTYKTNNIEVLEAYDEDLEFYIINKKKCIGYREPKWFESLGMKNTSLEEKITRYKDMNVIDYHLIVNTKTFDLDALKLFFYNLSKINIKPKKLTIIRYLDKKLLLPYKEIELLIKKYNISYLWKIQTIIDKDISDQDILHQIIVQNPKYRFVLYADNSTDTLNDLVNIANNIVYNKLDQFFILATQNKQNIIFSSGVYRYEFMCKNNILIDQSKYTII